MTGNVFHTSGIGEPQRTTWRVSYASEDLNWTRVDTEETRLDRM